MTKAERRARKEARKQKRREKQASGFCSDHDNRREPIKGRTKRQAEYLTAILNNPQVVVSGPAGTGKTFIPTALAADMLTDGNIERIILCRPAIEKGEYLGHLPGGIGEKMEPWVRPFFDELERRLGKTDVRRAVNAGQIQVVPFAFMRGLTFRDAFIILDEAQSTTPQQMKMFLTRLGENVKVVINGDPTQKGIQGESGLELVIRTIRQRNMPIPVITFEEEDVVRSELCKLWTEALEEVDNAQIRPKEKGAE